MVINCGRQAADDMVVIAVRDNGCGMSPEVLKKAFDPFYSHRAAGRGRGMGLPQAWRMVELNGGRIWFDSSVGAGTTAWLSLPCRPSTDQAAR